jgi:hypothetical protein
LDEDNIVAGVFLLSFPRVCLVWRAKESRIIAVELLLRGSGTMMTERQFLEAASNEMREKLVIASLDELII